MEQKGVMLAISAFFGMITAWLGVLAIPVYILVGSNIIDYLTGIMASRHRGEKVSSQVGFAGIAKKVCQWLLVIVGWMVDVLIRNGAELIAPTLEVPIFVAAGVAYWLAFNEIISILENIDEVGVKIPGFLKKAVQYFLNATEKEMDGKVPDIDLIDLDDEDNDTDVPED